MVDHKIVFFCKKNTPMPLRCTTIEEFFAPGGSAKLYTEKEKNIRLCYKILVLWFTHPEDSFSKWLGCLKVCWTKIKLINVPYKVFNPPPFPTYTHTPCEAVLQQRHNFIWQIALGKPHISTVFSVSEWAVLTAHSKTSPPPLATVGL